MGGPEKLERMYHEVEKRIGLVRFDRIWSGFSPARFALYDREHCYFDGHFVEKTDDFLANTTICYHGENIAIWQLDSEDPDPDKLTASLVHEMFHAFQQKNREKRYPHELKMLLEYRYDPEEIQIRIREAQVMKNILLGGKQADFGELMKLRKSRKERFPVQYGYESLTEQIEGTACFAEMSALESLNSEKAGEMRKACLTELERPEFYLPMRVSCYDSGALLLECVRVCTGKRMDCFSDVPFAEEILEGIKPETVDLKVEGHVSEAVETYISDTREWIRDVVQNGEQVLDGCYPLAGLNVWDARSDGTFVTSQGFLAVMDGQRQRTLEGSFAVKLDGLMCVTGAWRKR